MAKQGRRGRPRKSYTTSWGEPVEGLARDTDGRWRIVETGYRYSEADERRAVARFRQLHRPERVHVPATLETTLVGQDDEGRFDGPIIVRSQTLAQDFWPWLREQLIAQPAYVAKMVGIPELANLRHLPLPKPAITIDQLVEAYEQQNPSTKQTKQRVIRTFRKLARFAEAKALEDLTQEILLAWRNEIENDPNLKSAATRQQIYGQIKTMISFGLKVGLDQTQIRAALDRCSVLWTAEPLPPVDPQPISRDDFHRLLAAADGVWRAWLLLALNLCMTAEDLCELRWKHFDLEAGTYAAVRVKTKRDRIPRAGVLWPETMAALSKIRRRSEYVFTSQRGTRYSKNSRVNLFADLRQKAGLPDSVKMTHIRDASYTIASRATTDERWARVLAGHRAPGLQDHYVLRSPEATREACEAVYKAFGPFPV